MVGFGDDVERSMASLALEPNADPAIGRGGASSRVAMAAHETNDDVATSPRGLTTLSTDNCFPPFPPSGRLVGGHPSGWKRPDASMAGLLPMRCATAGDDVQVRLPSWGSPVRRSAGAANGVGAVAVGERDRERGAAAGYGGVVAEARPPPRGSGMVLY